MGCACLMRVGLCHMRVGECDMRVHACRCVSFQKCPGGPLEQQSSWINAKLPQFFRSLPFEF
jgi:hypothetical protein